MSGDAAGTQKGLSIYAKNQMRKKINMNHFDFGIVLCVIGILLLTLCVQKCHICSGNYILINYTSFDNIIIIPFKCVLWESASPLWHAVSHWARLPFICICAFCVVQFIYKYPRVYYFVYM